MYIDLYIFQKLLLFVTHLHEISRMSAPYKLRKWEICMIWANNSKFSSKPRIIILRPEMDYTFQY